MKINFIDNDKKVLEVHSLNAVTKYYKDANNNVVKQRMYVNVELDNEPKINAFYSNLDSSQSYKLVDEEGFTVDSVTNENIQIVKNERNSGYVLEITNLEMVI